MRCVLLASTLLASALVPFAGQAAGPRELKSVKVDLPTGDKMFPPGPGSDEINNNCLSCHSAGMVLNQPPLPKTTWAEEVHKMIDTYKAPVDPKDVEPIVNYLSRLKGK
jgi:hypothetical protein